MKRYNLIIIIIVCLFCNHISLKGSTVIADLDTIVNTAETIKYKNPLDNIYKRKPNGTIWIPDFLPSSTPNLYFRDTMFVNPLFLPVVFMGNKVYYDFSENDEYPNKGLLLKDIPSFEKNLKHYDFIRNVRRTYYNENAENIGFSRYTSFRDIQKVKDDDVLKTFEPFKEPIIAESEVSMEKPDVKGAIIQPKYWIYTGEHSLQFSQNYFSDNWHKGGNSNLNINNYHVIRANYKKNKVRFNNMLEWRLSLFSAGEDSIRKFRIGEDLIRYYGDLGIDAFIKKWSYSTNWELKTQLFNNYPVNSNELRSAFLSPLYANAGVGLKYELDKKSDKVRHQRIRWTLAIAPISANLKYIANPNVNVTKYGIPEGRNFVLDIGSTITSLLTYDFNKYATWESRFKYFTSYKKMEGEFENTLNMAVTRFFSTRIYVNLRYDDMVAQDPSFGYFQINEVLSFGFNYKW